MSKLLTVVQDNNEDFEWYPTTDEIIEAMYKDIHAIYSTETFSMLDIGGGNAKVFNTIDKLSSDDNGRYKARLSKKYVIEKSKTLINSMPSDTFVVGTDFWQQTLIDKKVDVIYCNPPYSEFDSWATKIIREANCSVIYLTIPTRWEKSPPIKAAMELRSAKAVEIGQFSFVHAEDRAARANVSLLKIELRRGRVDPFKLWFDETFKIDLEANKATDREVKQTKAESIKELVKGRNLIERLEELYTQDMDHLMENYSAVSNLDVTLLQELGVSLAGLLEGIKTKISGIKNLYWQELFGNLNTITDRLTEKSRKALLETLTSHTSVDFTAENAYAITIWAIKNANQYYEKQLLDLYYRISCAENVTLYKSNHRMIKDGWRYYREEMSHYALDYRIVHHSYNALDSSTWRSINGLSENASEFIGDIIAVAGNLGFNTIHRPSDFTWSAGCKNLFMMNKDKPFAEVKVFKNGNIHLKFAPEFMRALNVEAGRLNNWIKSPKEASQELDITEDEAAVYFGNHFTLLPSEAGQLLLGSPQNDNREA